MAFRTRLFARRDFPLPKFDLRPLSFELNMCRDGCDSAAAGASGPGAPTAGQLHDSIERYLEATRTGPQPAGTPPEELRDALAELRQSLR